MHGVIDGPADWRGPDLARLDDWVYHLNLDDVAEVEAALAQAIRRDDRLTDMIVEDFPLAGFADRLATARDSIETRYGIYLFRGFPVTGHDEEALRRLYWGIGRHIGTAVSQSKRGDLIGDVRDIGTDISGREGRGYTSRAELEYHTDSTDVSALFVLNTAKSGGLSRFVSSLAIHNEIARTCPDLLEVLYEPYVWSRQGQECPGEPAWYDQPIFGIQDGHFASRYIRTHIFSAQKHHGVPPMSDAQREALALIDRLADDPAFKFEMMMQTGDMVFLNSHVTYHSRTEFEDHDEPEKKRHLLRLWLSVPNSRPLPEGWSAIYHDRRPGVVRGGFPGHTDTPTFMTT